VSDSDQYKCFGNCLDEDVAKRYQQQYCSGTSSSCSGTKSYTDGYNAENCGANQFCSGSTSWGAAKPTCKTAQCIEGECCDSSCGNFKFRPTSYACITDLTWNGCPWGESIGSDVGQKVGDRYCNGYSTACNGEWSWTSWSVKQDCNNEQYCMGGEGPNELSCTDIACTVDADCGPGSWGSTYCKDNDVYAVFTAASCQNGGTKESSCAYSNSEKRKQDCGASGYSGSTYCWNYNGKPSVFQDYATKGCSDGSCFENTEKKLIKECVQGCTNGQCDEDACQNDCGTGEARCEGTSLQTCGNYDADSCLEWIGDDCTDCSCSCGGFSVEESDSMNNCNDNKDNDCDGAKDSLDAQCSIQFAISLNPGWNLISFPLLLNDKKIKDVFAGINFKSIVSSNRYYYSEDNKSFELIDESDAYWVYSGSMQTLRISGRETDGGAKEGWSGYLSLHDYTEPIEGYVIYMYNNSRWYTYNLERPERFNTLKRITPGYGYFIKKI